MIFIEKTDFYQIIRQDVLNNLIENDDAKLDTEEAFAMAKVEAYLGARYDLAAEYALTGDDRNKMLMRAIMALMLYTLYGVRSSADIPEHIEDKKLYALEWLEGVRDEKLSTNLALSNTEDGRQGLFLSTGTKYSRAF